MSKPIVFWRDGYTSGKSGAFVRGASLNEVVAKWEAEGVRVAGIVIDPSHGSNVNLIIATPTPEAAQDGERARVCCPVCNRHNVPDVHTCTPTPAARVVEAAKEFTRRYDALRDRNDLALGLAASVNEAEQTLHEAVRALAATTRGASHD